MVKLECGHCQYITDGVFIGGFIYKCTNPQCNALNDVSEFLKAGAEPEDKVLKFEDKRNDLTVKEWAGFDYVDYQAAIANVINKDNFDKLSAIDASELAAGYLTQAQVEDLKKILKTAILKNWSLRDVMKEIKSKVEPGDLAVELESGATRIIGEEQRIEMIARSELTRLVNDGSLKNMQENGIKRVKFCAALGDRTCELCASLDGMEMDIDDAYGYISDETHVNCRCSWDGITE